MLAVMSWDDEEGRVGCTNCGRGVSESEGEAYAFGTQSLLCFECAVARGGRYDEGGRRWTVAPRVEDLLQRSEVGPVP